MSNTTTKTQTTVRFTAAKKIVNPDTDVLLSDIRSGKFPAAELLEEALTHQDEIRIVGQDLVQAQEAADAFNELLDTELATQAQAAEQLKAKQQKEEKKMTEAKTTVDKAFDKKKEEEASIVKTKRAQEFLKKHAGTMQDAKTAPKADNNQKEENKMTTKTNTQVTMGSKAMKQEEENTMTTNHTTEATKETAKEETKTAAPRRRLGGSTPSADTATTDSAPRRRLSSSADTAPNTTAKMGAGRLKRTESIRQQFVKHEGPWYLNAELYPVLNRFESILDTMSDAELGIENIVLVDPADLKRYDRKVDVHVVIQVMSNGVVLEFPIKESKSSTSKSDLSSTSIGWVQAKNGMRPAFGFYRSNFPVVTATCTCGNKMEEVSASNLYCYQCKTRHDDAEVAVSHKALGLAIEEFTFQTIPNLEVPKDLLALVMAVAQYDAELPMHGIIADDAE